jgi:hypothetical protein
VFPHVAFLLQMRVAVPEGAGFWGTSVAKSGSAI